ncbi:SRPBCC family protein [Homoserinimonas sp. OAct 916]|uniref:SRPBCC family protein n=1 Tax=Homoserinimonas sp. OAct 916 TaxID=2211450 RepID=UPI000DBE2724|nr:SRPBCC family protein [Homoserinimonas sp. OAct 916]
MKLNHTFVVPAALDVTWAAFNDLDGLVPCLPGARLISAEGDGFAGEVKVKLGPISMLYGGTGVFIERDQAAGRMVVEAKGKDKRGNGTAGATVTAQLTADGTGTSIEVITDLSVTGKPAQFGRGVIQDVSDKLLGQFVDCISKKLNPAAEEEPPAAETEGGAGSEGAAPAIKVPAGSSSDPDAPSAAPRPAPTQASREVHSGPSDVAEPAELDLLSTVMPVFLRRYALQAAIALAAIVAVWVWLARRSK